MSFEERTEPASDIPKKRSRKMYIGAASASFLILLFFALFPKSTSKAPNGKSTQVAAVNTATPLPVPTIEEISTPMPEPTAALPIKKTSNKEGRASKSKPKVERKETKSKSTTNEAPQVDDSSKYLALYSKVSPSSFEKLGDLLAKRKLKKGEKDELKWMKADVKSYLGYRKKNKSQMVEGLALANDWMKDHPKSDYAIRSLSFSHWALGEYLQSATEAKRSLELIPGDGISRFLLNSSLYFTGKEVEGLEGLKDTFAKFPEIYPAGEHLVQIYLNRGQYTDAEPVARKLLSLEPRDPMAVKSLAYSLEGQGKWDELIQTFSPLAAKDKNSSELKLMLSQAYRRTDRFKQANRYLAELIQIQSNGGLNLPKNKLAIYYSERGKLDFDQQKYTESITHFQKSLELDSSNSSMLKYLAGALYRVKKYKEASEVYEKAVRADPDDLGTRQYHGMALLESNQMDQAEQVFQDVLKRGADNAPVLFYLARVEQSRGNNGLAIRYCEQALSIDSNHQGAKLLLKKLKP